MKTTRFTTETGSRYEVDAENKQIRRLSGANAATKRQGKDGDWKKYENISSIEIGKSVIIDWGGGEDLLEETKSLFQLGVAIPATMTSWVVDIKNDD